MIKLNKITKQKVKKIINIFFSFTFCLVGILFLFTSKIKSVECNLNQQSCDGEIVDRLNLNDQSFFFTDIEAEVNQVEFGFPVQLNQVERIFPNKLKISLSQSEYLYQLNFGQIHLSVDSEGNYYPIEQDSSVIVQVEPSLYESLLEEKKIDNRFHQGMVSLTKLLEKNNYQIKSINYQSGNLITIILINYPQILVDPDNFENQVFVLELIINKLSINDPEKNFRELDLRFKFPILRE